MNRWQDAAACKGLTDAMYPARGDFEGLQRALAICASCTVRAECLDYVMHLGEKEGVWAGTTGRERRAIKHVSPCGTRNAYARGCRCDDCRAANAKHRRTVYVRNLTA